MYGNAIRPKTTVRSKRSSPTNPLAIIQTKAGIAKVAQKLKTIRMAANIEKASRAKSLGASFASSFLEKIGTKAMLKAPSAKNRRNKLGIEKAITKASATGLEPRAPAINTSRRKPKTRDTKVQSPTVKNPLIIFMITPVERPA